MSEPVIKPRFWCKECGEVDAGHTSEFVQSFRHQHVVHEGYTRDDLVRVARECNRLWDESTAFDDETDEATRVVDRLTKGET